MTYAQKVTGSYHIAASGKSKGTVVKCSAKSKCTLKGDNPHFETIEEGNKWISEQAEQENGGVFGETGTINKTKLSNPSSSNSPSFTFGDKIIVDELSEFDEERYINDSESFLKKLDESDRAVVAEYVQDLYQDVNEHLYGNVEASSALKVKIEQLDNALGKYDGNTPKDLWRNFGGSSLNKEFIEENYTVGDEIVFHGFTSTTETGSGLSPMLNAASRYMEETDPENWEHENGFRIKVSEEYLKDGNKGRNVLFCIRAKKAVPVSMMRGNVSEQEWLIPRGKKFRVTEIHHNRELIGGNMRENTFAHVYVLDEL